MSKYTCLTMKKLELIKLESNVTYIISSSQGINFINTSNDTCSLLNKYKYISSYYVLSNIYTVACI